MFKIKRGILMTKPHRLSLLTTIYFLALFIFASHAYALFSSNVDKAKEFMQAGMYPQAIALLEKEINDNPTNAEAHFQLGICYINQNNYSSADERFSSAVRLKPDYGYKIGKEFKKAADAALKKGSLSTAETLFDEAIEYDPSLKKQGYDFFIALGDRAQSAHYYDRALQYEQGSEEKKKKIGFKFLKLAVNEWPGSRSESLKQKASLLVGDKIVQNVFPAAYTKVVFEKIYTFEDAYDKEYGQIQTIKFGEDDVRIGDQIEVIAHIKGSDTFSGDEIWIWRGEEFNPMWVPTKNGYHSRPVETFESGKYFVISLGGRKDVEVKVRAKRKMTPPPPNIDLLNEYMASFETD